VSGYESPSPEEETTGESDGDATGGGSPGDQDAMGADDGMTVEEGAGRPEPVEDDADLSDLP
jgi:hypothetical protein